MEVPTLDEILSTFTTGNVEAFDQIHHLYITLINEGFHHKALHVLESGIFAGREHFSPSHIKIQEMVELLVLQCNAYGMQDLAAGDDYMI